MAQRLTIPASDNLDNDFVVSIPINNDRINEATEDFLILIEASETTANMAEAPLINYERDGLTIGRIVDDDGQ